MTDVDESQYGKLLLGVEIKGGDDLIEDWNPQDVILVNGMGSVGVPAHRKNIFDLWTQKGYRFASIIHSTAIVSKTAKIETGVQVMAGAVIQAGVTLGANSIINSGSTVDHDCHIGRHCHIAPKVALSGSITVADCSHVGTAACVIQGISIGQRCVVGAGATVIRDLSDDTTVVGTPAKPVSYTHLTLPTKRIV